MRYPGMIAAVIILVILALLAIVFTSPSGQQFMNMFGSGGLQEMTPGTGSYSQSNVFGLPR
jgi:hypothetical protein